jgi:hypothetical protein
MGQYSSTLSVFLVFVALDEPYSLILLEVTSNFMDMTVGFLDELLFTHYSILTHLKKKPSLCSIVWNALKIAGTFTHNLSVKCPLPTSAKFHKQSCGAKYFAFSYIQTYKRVTEISKSFVSSVFFHQQVYITVYLKLQILYVLIYPLTSDFSNFHINPWHCKFIIWNTVHLFLQQCKYTTYIHAVHICRWRMYRMTVKGRIFILVEEVCIV